MLEKWLRKRERFVASRSDSGEPCKTSCHEQLSATLLSRKMWLDMVLLWRWLFRQWGVLKRKHPSKTVTCFHILLKIEIRQREWGIHANYSNSLSFFLNLNEDIVNSGGTWQSSTKTNSKIFHRSLLRLIAEREKQAHIYLFVNICVSSTNHTQALVGNTYRTNTRISTWFQQPKSAGT